jgi:hypothetical protein
MDNSHSAGAVAKILVADIVGSGVSFLPLGVVIRLVTSGFNPYGYPQDVGSYIFWASVAFVVVLLVCGVVALVNRGAKDAAGLPTWACFALAGAVFLVPQVLVLITY